MRMPKFISCREFLERKQKQKKYQNCLVRIFDFDEYEHMNFRLREEDSYVSEYFIFKDEDGITICLNGDIEL